MGRRRNQLDEVRFRCGSCRLIWSAAPDLVEDAPDDDWHPWRYFADCSVCGAAEQPQDPNQRRMLKMWAKATGPRTAAGKAAVTANLAGHPTPEEARRTRFNRMEHGLYARTAKYFPAKPGKYPQCYGCEYRLTICDQQIACLKKTELLLRHQVAFDTKDPGMLTGMRADMQAGITALIDDIILTIAQDGVRLKVPKTSVGETGVRVHTYVDEEGREQTIHEISAHPLLRQLGDFLTKNGLSLADLRMTPRVVEEEEVVRGQLEASNAASTDLNDYQRRQTEALEGLRVLVEQARADTARDPVLLEHQRNGIEGGAPGETAPAFPASTEAESRGAA